MKSGFYLILFVAVIFIEEIVNGDYIKKEETSFFDISQNTNEEDWVDPNDIFNYDRSTKSMYQNTRKVLELHQCEDKLKHCEAQIEKLSQTQPSRQNVENLCQTSRIVENVKRPSDPNSSQKKITVEDGCMQSVVYMRRFVNILLKAAQLNHEMPLDLDVDLRMSVTIDQLKILQLFGSGGKSIPLQELESVLSSVLFTARKSMFGMSHDIPWSAIFEFLMSKQVLVSVALGLVPMLIWRMLSGHSVIRTLFIFLVAVFMMSFVITYLQMYKQEEIKQYAILKKNPNVPVECRPTSELSWFEMFGRIMSSKLSYKSDVCEKYYEALMMDPFLKVTPTTVLSEMIGSFILHPSGMLGNAIAKFSSGILGNLPFGTNYIVLFGSFVLIIFIVFASCGGIIKLPFYLGGVELRGRRTVPRITSESQRPTIEAKQEIHEDGTISQVMKALGSSEHGLFITNAKGIQILSRSSSCINENIGSLELEERHSPGCCGESNTQCRHVVNTSATEFLPISHTQPKKNRTEEIRMEKSKSPGKQEERINSSESSSYQMLENEKICRNLQDKEIRTVESEEVDKLSDIVKGSSIHSNERVQTLDPTEYNLCSGNTLLSKSETALDDTDELGLHKSIPSRVSQHRDVNAKSLDEDCDGNDFIKV